MPYVGSWREHPGRFASRSKDHTYRHTEPFNHVYTVRAAYLNVPLT